MIRYTLILITVLLNAGQYYGNYKNITLNWGPLITKFTIATNLMLIVTFFLTKFITNMFYKKNPECKQYDDGKPIAGAAAIADVASFVLCFGLVCFLLP